MYSIVSRFCFVNHNCFRVAFKGLVTTFLSPHSGHYVAYIYSKFHHGCFPYRLPSQVTSLSHWHPFTISWIFCQRAMAYFFGSRLKSNVMAGLPTRTLREGDYEGSPIPPCGDFARSASSVRTSPWLQQSTKEPSSPTS